MHTSDIETRATQLARRFESARTKERANLRPELERVIRTLKSRHQPLPNAVCRVDAVLEEDAFEEMFDNMPL